MADASEPPPPVADEQEQEPDPSAPVADAPEQAEDGDSVTETEAASDAAADAEVASITAGGEDAQGKTAIALHPTALLHGTHVEGEEAAADAHGEAEANLLDGQPEQGAQMVLWSVQKMEDGKRAQLMVMDASKDPDNLSSKLVTQCFWVSDNVPRAIKGTPYTPNQALISLRNALDPSKKALGSNGINCKVNLCTNESGTAQTVKRMIQTKQLHKFLI